MIHRSVKINSSNVSFYVQKGDNIPLVFIHGFCEDSGIWDDFLINFQNEYLICIDLPGFGKSEYQKDCTIQDMASIVDNVLKKLNINKYILTGHSMGGYVTLEIARRFPEKILGLCLFHSQPFADSSEKKENRQKSIDFIQDNGSIYFVKQLIPKLFASKFGSESSLVISNLIHTASQYPANGIINALKAMIQRTDNQEVLKNVEFPVLFIVGDEDQAIPIEYSFKQLALPNIADIHILNGVGHMGMFEAKHECVSILQDFIAFVGLR